MITITIPKILKYLLLPLLLILVGFWGGYRYRDYNSFNNFNNNNHNHLPQSKDITITDTTTTTLTDKTSPSAPDVVVNHDYTVKINNDTIKIPPNKTATTTITTDLTPVVKTLAEHEYKKNWEVGLGVGVLKDGTFYVPIAIQRNYNFDRAVELQVGLKHDGSVPNVSVVHKWKF